MKKKPKFRVGQVVRCVRNEYMPSICPERFHVVDSIYPNDPDLISVDGYKLCYADYVRPLTRRERGPERKS